MRKLITTILILIMIASTAVGETIFCKPNDTVNVRARATTRSSVEGFLECGDEIETDGKTAKDKQGRTWVHIVNTHLEIGDAWVCGMYVSDSPVTIENTYAYVSAKGRTALRRSPNGERIKWLKNGEELEIIAYSEEWALTTRGYVSLDCIDFYGGEIDE